MKNARYLLVSSAAFLVFASCNKSRSVPPGAGSGGGAEEIAAERALIEEERMELERQRLREERLALEEEKAALEAEREARLAAREREVESDGLSLEERRQQLEERERDLAGREDELASREMSLSEQELELAGRDVLDDWEPEPLPELQEPVADYGTFYDDLQPYGSWYETPDYGYVYQPTVVVQDRTWRPYTRGRWVCTNLGWNWVSDEPFGWACFHYGRWALLHGRGWVWVPGDEWAPSWVCWREGGDHVGWAPLPPETLCHRGRGWDGSVEAEFGIGSLCFNFVHRRHMAEPLWRHCLPVEENPLCLGQTNNITNIRYDGNRVIAGGPSYQRLRRDVGKAWPVYRIETDRFQAIRDLNRRNATVRGHQIEVFAPNLNTRWNDRLKPSNVAGRWDDVKVVRAESGIKPEWSERFREMRSKRIEESKKPVDPVERKALLEGNRGKVAEAQRSLLEKQRQMNEARRGTAGQPVQSKTVDQPAPDHAREPSLAERQRLAAERLREARERRTGGLPPSGTGTGEQGKDGNAGRIAAMREELRQRELARKERQSGSGDPVDPTSGKPETKPRVLDKPDGRGPRPSSGVTRNDPPVQGGPVVEDQRPGGVRQQPVPPSGQDEPARQESDQGRLRQAMEERRQQQEQLRQRQEEERQASEENQRNNRMQEALRQQQEAARAKAEQAREEMAQRQRELEAARARQADEARQRQELARREAEENQRRQQQEEMKRQQQEQARQQQEEIARRRQEEQAQRQEQMRQQQEEARRQAEERERQQQEERARQQEQARQQQEERARQQEQERQQREQEQQRRQEERAREQQERQEQSRQRGR